MTAVDTTSSLDIATSSTTSLETGNQITGYASSSETDNTTDSTDSTDTNQTSTVVTSSTAAGTDTTQRSGNSITGGYSFTETSSNSTTSSENDNNTPVVGGSADPAQADVTNSTASEADSSTATETGNEITGTFANAESGATSGTLTSIEYDQSQTISISQVDTGTTSATTAGDNVTGQSSGTSFDSDTSSVFPAETNLGNLVGPPVMSAAASETDLATDSTTFSANDVTGFATTSSHDTDTLSRPESIVNASEDVVGGKYSWTTVDSYETANSVTGSFDLAQTTSGSFSNHETDANSGLSTTNTETGTLSGTLARSGNDVLGSYTLSESNSSLTTVVESDSVTPASPAPGTVTTSGTTTESDVSSVNGYGNDVTGFSSTSESDASSSTHVQSDAYGTVVSGSPDHDTQTITTTGSDGSTGTSNTITGDFSLAETSSTTVWTAETGSRGGNTFTAAGSDTTSVSNATSGNSIAGTQSTSETDIDTATTNDNGKSSVGSYAISQSDQSTTTLTGTDNTFVGNSTQTSSSTDTTSVSETSWYAPSLSFVDNQKTVTATTSGTEVANTITGAYSSTSSESDVTTLVQTGANSGGYYSMTATSSESPTITESGSTITGYYTFSEAATQGYTFTQQDSHTSGPTTTSYSILETGTQAYSLTQSGNHVTGGYSLLQTGTDSYTVAETGGTSTTGGGGGGSYSGGGSSSTWGLTLSGADHYTTSEGGNELSGLFNLTTTGSGTDSLSEGGSLQFSGYNHTPTTGYTLSESGNYLSGQISITETGSDRYALINGFNNASNAATTNSNGPGDVDYSPVGAPFHMGQSPYWGKGVAADLNAAASDAAFNELGLGLLHEYCFGASAWIVMASGVYKPIAEVQRGEYVMAVPDDDPDAPPRRAKVAEVFKNPPAAQLNLHIRDEYGEESVIPVTANHPCEVVGRGWTPAGHLRISDRVRSPDGREVTVSDSFDNGDVGPTYNLRVPGCRTFYVSGSNGGPAMLVHNTSPGEKTKNPPSTAGENEYAQEGRVAGAAIEEQDKALQRSDPQARTLRNGNEPGRQDIGVGGTRKKGAEIGPGTRTGVPKKVAQNESLPKEGHVILYRQSGKPPKAGDTVEFVELTATQAKKLAAEINKNKSWDSEAIFARAKQLASGKSNTAVVSEKAAAYAGEVYRRGQKVGSAAQNRLNSRRGILVVPVPSDASGLMARLSGAASATGGRLQAAGSAGVQMFGAALLESALEELDHATGDHIYNIMNHPHKYLDPINEALGGDPEYFSKMGDSYNGFWSRMETWNQKFQNGNLAPDGDHTGWIQYRWYRLTQPEAYDDDGRPIKKASSSGGSGDQ